LLFVTCKFIRQKMKSIKPRLFIGSSVEGLKVAYAIQKELEYDSDPTVWKQGIFKPGSFPLTSLINAINNSDFAIFVFTSDDIAIIREKKISVIRDNIIFEFGLFVGGLGKDRVFFVKPRNASKLHLPTDLAGVIPGTYNNKRPDNNLCSALAPFCEDVRNIMKSFSSPNPTKGKIGKKRKKGKKGKTVVKSQKITALQLFNGSWRNDYVFNSQPQAPEFFEIKDGNKYCINGLPFFYIENIKIDSKNNILTFEKNGINDTRKLVNILNIINEKMYVGHENGKTPITYTKIS
jgi:hypothetical protein